MSSYNTEYYCSAEDVAAGIETQINDPSVYSGITLNVYQGSQITIPAVHPTIEIAKITVKKASRSTSNQTIIVNNYEYGGMVLGNNFNTVGISVRVDNNGKLTLSNNSKELTVNNNGTVVISGSRFNDTRIINGNSGVINIEGIYCDSNVTTPNIITNNGGTINISDGKFTSEEAVSIINNSGTISVTGGVFCSALYDQIRDNIADGYAAYRQEDGTYKVASLSYVAKVGDTPYDDLLDALIASSEETPAVLQTNVSLSDYLLSARTDFLDMNGFNIHMDGSIIMRNNASLKIMNAVPSEGGVISASNVTQGSLIHIYGAGTDIENATVLDIKEGVTIKNTANDNYGISIFNNPALSSNAAYGVVVNIAGKVLTENGTALCINGQVQATEGHVPQINIADGAVLGNAGEGCSQACIYAAGYGNWNIGAASLKANTPIYAKSGSIIVNGATIEACGEYAAPVANSNGFNPTGDAIMIDSHASYAGNVQLSVSGTSTITSENGYAVQEALTKMDQSKAIGLTIAGGLFTGAKGTVKLSDEFAQNLADGSDASGNWTLNAVTSGKYTSKPEVVADGYEIVEVSGQYPFLYEVKAKTSTSYTEVSLDADQDAYTVENGYELVVKNGKTLNIGTLTIGTDENYPSRVRVQPGGTLVVGSIVMNNSKGAESLLLESDGNGTGKLLFNSDNIVTTLGTVELFAQCRVLDADNKVYLFQHIGIPMYPIGGSIEKEVATAYAQWNVRSGWYYTNSESVINQGIWSGSNVTTNTPNAGSVFKFKGELLGNNDAEFLFAGDDYGYKCLANSYTAPMSMVELIDAYKTINGADGTVWVYKASDYEKKGKNFVQWNKVDAVDENAAIDPMQAFFVLHKANTNDSFSVNYEDAVYNYNKGVNASIRDAEAVTVENKGKISIFDGESTATLSLYEGEGLSDSFDMDYDGYQMETGNIQIYIAQDGEKWSSFASNSLNSKEITIVSKAKTDITMSFSKLGGNAFKITDLASGYEVEVSEESTYRFTVEANSTAVRFRIGNEVSANEADADAVKVWVADNALNIAGTEEGDAIEVINLAGVKVLSATATGEAVQTISLSGIANGAYIVKAGAATVKVIK